MTVRLGVIKGVPYTCSLQKFCENTEYFKKEENCRPHEIMLSILNVQEEGYYINDTIVKIVVDFINKLIVPPFTISNAVPILAVCKYLDVTHLKGLVSMFIDNHPDEIIKEFLDEKPTECPLIYERLIAKNLVDHINNPALFNFPIASLHRILSRFEKDGGNLCTYDMINFLTRGLDKIGRDFSVIIQLVPVGSNSSVENYFLTKMLEHYKDKFDPVFLNPCHLKYLWDNRK